jgi:hypothetical protein
MFTRGRRKAKQTKKETFQSVLREANLPGLKPPSRPIAKSKMRYTARRRNNSTLKHCCESRVHELPKGVGVNVSLGVTSGDQSRHSLQNQGEVQKQHRRQIYNSIKILTTFAVGGVHCSALKL